MNSPKITKVMTMNGENYISELIIKRKANQSTTSFLITSDEMRIRDTIRMLWGKDGDKIYGIFGDSEASREKIYIYDGWKGISKVSGVDKDGGIDTKEVSDSSSETDMFKKLEKAQQKNKGIGDIDRILKTEKAIVIVTNARLEKPRQPEALDMALESWTQDSEIFERESTLIVFTHSTSVFQQKTIDNSTVITIPASTADERRNIINKVKVEYSQVKKCKALLDVTDADIDVVVSATGGLNKAQTESAMLESIYRYGKFDLPTITNIKTDMINKKSSLTVHKVKVGFEGIGGYEFLKGFFTSRIIKVVRNRKSAEALGLKYPKGYVVFGMPGTGKTVLAKALAKEVDMPFVELNLKNIKRGIVGESEQRLNEALKTIDAMSPCVVFIDEIDRLGSRGKAGGELDGGTSKEIFSELLSWLGDENRQAIVIATTNRPQDLDDAMRRVGRFDGLVPMLLPDPQAREAILKVHTSVKSKIPLAKDVNLAEIAEKCEYYNGAEVEAVCQRATFTAFNEGAEKVSQKHFLEAVDTFIVNREERKKQFDEYLALAKKFTNDTRFYEKAEDSQESKTDRRKRLRMLDDTIPGA